MFVQLYAQLIDSCACKMSLLSTILSRAARNTVPLYLFCILVAPVRPLFASAAVHKTEPEVNKTVLKLDALSFQNQSPAPAETR